jgi:predicted component of type VI protein secretion system
MKLQSSEQTVVVPTIEEAKFIESTKVVLVVPTEASVDAIEKPETEKTTEKRPQLLSPLVVAELPKLSITATTTPRREGWLVFSMLFWNQ